MTYTVGPKGQIVVAKDIRDKLGIEPGWMALQRIEDGHLVVYFLPPEHNRSLLGILAPFVPDDVDDEDWDRVTELAWEAAARERAARLEEK